MPDLTTASDVDGFLASADKATMRTNIGLGTADELSAPVFAADAGSTDTYVATLSPAPSAYVTGAHYRFKANTANTGAATINFNSLGAITIVKAAGGITTTLANNDIRAGQWVDVVYDGTNMQMQSTLGNAASGGTSGYVVKTANYTAVAGDKIAADVTGGAFTVTLPATPANGDTVEIIPANGTFATNNLTVARNGENIDGAATNSTLSSVQGSLYVYSSGNGWRRFAMTSYTGAGSVVVVGQGRFDPVYGTIFDGSVNINSFASTSILNMDGTGNAGFSSPSYNSGILNMTCLAGMKMQLTAQGALSFGQIATPSAPASNFAHVYAKDVSGTAEIFAMDEAGNETQISPHNHTAPSHLVDDPFDEVGYTANYYTGIITYTNKARQLAGRSDGQLFETFAEHNARLGASLELWDWDTVQAGHVAKREQERTAWAERKAEWEVIHENAKTPFTETQPEILTAKPKPAWLVSQLAGLDAFLAARTPSITVTMCSFRFACGRSLWSSIESAAAGVQDADAQWEAQQFLEYSPTVNRAHPFVASLAAALGKTAAEVDAIFAAAKTLDHA